MNVLKADYLLKQQGYPIEGINSAGVISFQAGTTEQQMQAAYAYLATLDDAPIPTPIADYAQAFANNAKLWAKIHKTLDDRRTQFVVSGATATTILTNLRQQVQDVVTLINNNAPAGVIAEFQKERVLQGSTTTTLDSAGISTMTAAEFRIIIGVARQVANQGLAIVNALAALSAAYE